MQRVTRALLVVVVVFASIALARVKQGDFNIKNGNKELMYFSKFCFTNTEAGSTAQGTITINATLTTVSSTSAKLYWVLFYDDGNPSWDEVYHNKTGLSCSQTVAAANARKAMTVGVPMTWLIYPHDYVRPHFWYVALMNCDHATAQGEYYIKFINVDGSHFSFDERGMLDMSAVFFTFYLLLIGASAAADYFYWRKKLLHAILQALGICVIVITFSMLFGMSHWASYKNNGEGCPACLDISDLLDMAVEVMFTFLLIVLAKGWVITTQALTGKKLMIGLFTAIAASYLALYIWAAVDGDDAENSYVYATPPGIIILVLRLVTLAYFVIVLYFTLAAEVNKPKRIFYIVFGSAYGIWFLVLPFVSVVALAAPYWWRFKVIQGLHFTFTFLALSGLVGLLWPHYAHKFFDTIPADLVMTPTQHKVLSDTTTLL